MWLGRILDRCGVRLVAVLTGLSRAWLLLSLQTGVGVSEPLMPEL
jgi:hypothetical protein